MFPANPVKLTSEVSPQSNPTDDTEIAKVIIFKLERKIQLQMKIVLTESLVIKRL